MTGVRGLYRHGPAAAFALLGVVSCAEETPSAPLEELIPEVVTMEVVLPFSEFAKSAQSLGGYGRPSDLGRGFVARGYGDSLSARTLVRVGAYPKVAPVQDTGGTTRPDSSLTFISARIVPRFDTLASVARAPVRVIAEAMTEPWDAGSASWTLAVDTGGVQRAWSEPGGGRAARLGSAIWDPSKGDSISIAVDSLWTGIWSDSARGALGLRLTTEDKGTRLEVASTLLWIKTRPSLDPDTLLELQASTRTSTFLYTPLPAPPPGSSLRIGGAPAWRTVVEVEAPRTLRGPPELCRAVGCPVAIRPSQVTYAGLRFTTQRTEPAYAPSDSLRIDARRVLAPEILPKSPLGSSLLGVVGHAAPPEWFGERAGEAFEVPVTGFVRELLDPDSSNARASLSLLSVLEPASLEYGAFHGPESPRAPELRLLLSFARAGPG